MKDDHDDLHLELHREADNLGKFAAKISLNAPQGMTKVEAKDLMDTLMVNITDQCLSKGADIIGHVKGFLTSESGTIMASLVDPRIGTDITDDMSGSSFTSAELVVHAIVHGIWDPEVRDATVPVIDKVMKNFGIEYEVLQDYYEKEKSISHHMTEED